MPNEYWLIQRMRSVKDGGLVFSQKDKQVMSPPAKRVCFSCDEKYTGDIYCPSCQKPDGEVLEWADQDN